MPPNTEGQIPSANRIEEKQHGGELEQDSWQLECERPRGMADRIVMPARRRLAWVHGCPWGCAGRRSRQRLHVPTDSWHVRIRATINGTRDREDLEGRPCDEGRDPRPGTPYRFRHVRE